MAHPAQHPAAEAHLWQLLSEVPDPEIPVLSIVDLGIVRHVRLTAEGGVRVGLTPTYSGCPATEAIRDSVRRQLDAHGYGHAELEEVLSPPWSSDWLTAAGRAKLARFGIAPPVPPTAQPACPRCFSLATQRLSEFGSTPCKSHHRCRACGEPFDHFKCI